MTSHWRFLGTGVPEQVVALDAAPELYTVLYTVVCGGACFFRSFCPSTSEITVLTAFAVKSVSLQSDIRFRASCPDADDGVETYVIRALGLGTWCRRRARLAQLVHAPCWFAVQLCSNTCCPGQGFV